MMSIGRLIAGIEQGWSPTADERAAEEGEWAVLKLGAVFRGRFRPEQHKALKASTEPERRYESRAGDNELQRHDAVAERVRAQVEKLREYRQALITAAVTGKLGIAAKDTERAINHLTAGVA